MATVLSTKEARQGIGRGKILKVLLISLALAVIAGLLLGLWWLGLPWG